MRLVIPSEGKEARHSYLPSLRGTIRVTFKFHRIGKGAETILSCKAIYDDIVCVTCRLCSSSLLLFCQSFFYFILSYANLFTLAWHCPQPCFVFSSQSALSMGIFSQMTGQPEGQGKEIQRRRENPKQGSKADKKDRSVLGAILNARKAIRLVSAIWEG